MDQVLSVDRYAPHRHVLALSPQETSSKEVGPLRFCGRHLLDLWLQLGDRQQGKHILLPKCASSIVKNQKSLSPGKEINKRVANRLGKP